MERKWTVEQKQAIDARNRNLLVSAAAGSGKTAVLVQRILSIVLDENKPVDIDRLLVVTFTKAAAAEMKERIGNALQELLDKQPENVHLRKQMTLLHHAQICTIDSFCSYILRNYFYEIHMDPGFRVAEEGEMSLMKGDVLEKLLEEQFSMARSEFLQFVDYFATGKQDSNLEQLILQLHTFSESHPDPDKWLLECEHLYQMSTLEEVKASPMGRFFTRQVRLFLEELNQMCKEVRQLLENPEGPSYYEKALNAEEAIVVQMMETSNWQKWYQVLSARTSGRLVTPKNAAGSEQLRERAEEKIREIRSRLKDLQETFFAVEPSGIVKDLQMCASVVSTLIWLTREFGRRLFEKKQEKNVYDFSDLEHQALRVLVDEDGQPTETALAFREHFLEIMIDEYQDSNLLQECILMAISRSGMVGETGIDESKNNLFMVGDVKQSIYRFRQACPWLFTEKYDRYTREESPNQVINLRKNFRSRQQVLNASNEVFDKLMQRKVGDIDYDEDAALYLGADYGDEEEQQTADLSEVLCFSTESMPSGSQRADVIAAEAKMVANRILELTHKSSGLLVGGKESKKVAEYKDIVILLRSKGQWADIFVETLMDAGIPAYAESTTGFYKTREIQTIINYLSLIDNERQEIPLAAVLASPIGEFADLELAKVKAAFPNRPFYEGCREYVKYGMDESLRERLASFYGQLDGFRKVVPYTRIHEILWKLYDETGFYEYVAAMPGGDVRKANLDMLINQAIAFEKTSYTGLFQFLRYIERIQKYDIDIGEASGVQESMNAVRIMTIHKSKGLEFPIVFLSGLGKQFNDQDEKQAVVLHGESGIGVDAIDLEDRTKRTTVVKEILKWQNHLENRAEEIRLLYVAMTRAREKLILTVGYKEKDCLSEEGKGAGEKLTFHEITGAQSMWQWLRLIVSSSDEFICKEITCDELCDGEEEDILLDSVTDSENPLDEHAMIEDVSATASDDSSLDGDTGVMDKERIQDLYEELLRRISYVYPNNGQSYNAKLSVSELKKRASHDMDDAFESGALYKEPVVVPYLPKFAAKTKETKAVEKGTAYHKLLECMDYEMEPTKENVDRLLDALVSDGIMEKEAAATIDTEQMVTFLHSDIGKRMKMAALSGQLKREQPFVFGIPAKELHPEAKEEERILIQGIIDAYFVEDGQIVIVDYKTDRVSKRDGVQKLLALYQVQLEYYGRALQQLTQMPVKAAYIYSFALEKEILV